MSVSHYLDWWLESVWYSLYVDQMVSHGPLHAPPCHLDIVHKSLVGQDKTMLYDDRGPSPQPRTRLKRLAVCLFLYDTFHAEISAQIASKYVLNILVTQNIISRLSLKEG